jgi:hypothetical protein
VRIDILNSEGLLINSIQNWIVLDFEL